MARISWPTVCRAESSAAAYRRVLEWIRTKRLDELVPLIERAKKEKEDVVTAYHLQKEEERHKQAGAAYKTQARLMDDD